MDHKGDGAQYRSIILNNLLERNKRETVAFQDLVHFHNQLSDSSSVLKNENLRLSVQNETLRQDLLKGPSGSSDRAAQEKIHMLEQKVLAQQEELTELHKKRSENVQLLIDINAKQVERENEITTLKNKLQELVMNNTKLRAEVQLYQTNNKELQGLNQMLKDEHQALQLAFTHLEEKLRKAQDENREMVERLMKYKSKDVEKLNEENEKFVMIKHLRLQRDLEEAAMDPRGISPDAYLKDIGPVLCTSAVPTKASFHFEAHEGEISCVKWSPVDRVLATGGADRKVKLWDVSKGVPEKKGVLIGCNAGVMSIDFDSTGTLCLGASNDFASRVWTVQDQRMRHTLTGHSGKVMCAKFLGDPTKVASGSCDRTLKIWDLRSKVCTETKFAGSSCNDLVTYDGAGTTIISGHFDKKVRFWDFRSEEKVRDIELHGKITSLDLSKDCRYLLCCCRDDTLRKLDLRTNQIVSTFSAEGFKVQCDFTRAVFLVEDDYVAVGSIDGNIYVWDCNTGAVEAVLKDLHSAPVVSVAWQAFTSCLSSVDRSKQAVVWAN
uniref:Autophagy-related protein 16-1 n=1 Tax=Cacopsylla melanoneura TaxID=428564 RepID=A0A8D8WTQ0_9HEMI